nr:PREDICTED: probable inactive poly [ADP-ribose] polymerase SRO5 isoform X2 [Daucus carota subsp. sativus]
MNSSILLSDRIARKPSLLQNYGCFKNSGVVARLLYNSGGDWVDFEGSVVEMVRDCFVKKSGVVEVEIGGVLCLFDFYRMLVCDFEGEFEVSVGWIDVEGRSWFPKFVVGGDFEFSGFREREDVNLGDLGRLGKLEIEIRVSGGDVVNKGDGIRVSGGELVNKGDGIRVGGGELSNKGNEIRVGSGELVNKGNEVRASVGDLLNKGNGIRVSGGKLLNKGDGIRVNGGGLWNKRKREGGDVVEEEVKSVGSCTDEDGIKRRREGVCEEMESRRWNRVKVMGEGGKAGMVVRNLFLNWGGIKGIGAEITGVHQVTRTAPLDRARYEGFLNQVEMTKAARGEANVTFAWIKCSSEGVQRILSYGFSSPEKASLGEAFGVGIYLSPIKSSRVSVMPPDIGENHVILCRLILGKCEKVQAGSQQLYPSSPEFDTGVDDVSNPKWYIVWGANMNTHILPECIVSYKHNIDVLGQLSTTPRVGQSSAKLNLMWLPKVSNAMTAKFFANLIRSLPSSKVPELQALCCTYKAGKVPKGIFMKKLRSVVGDQMLRTAIQEVRG